MPEKHSRRDTLKLMAMAGFGFSAGLAEGEATQPSNRDDSSPIKLAQIGVGHPHANKIQVYRESPRYEVVGIAEPNPTLRKAAQSQKPYEGLTWMSVEELLKSPGLEVVLIETEIGDLLKYAQLTIDAGFHIHVDKPAGANLPDFEQLLAKAEATQRIVQLGYMYRFNPAVALLMQFLQDGWLGEVFEIEAVMSKVISANEREVISRFSGGTMFELAGHLVDLALLVLGPPEKVTPFLRHSGPGDDSVLDNGLAVLEWPKATATIRTTGVEVEGFQRRHFTVCGTFGTFEIQPLDNPSAKISLDRPRGDYKKGTQTVTFPRYRRYVGDAEDMYQILRKQTPNRFLPAHDLAVQKTLLQASAMPVR